MRLKMLIACFAISALPCTASADVPNFYKIDATSSGAPGTLIRSEPLAISPAGGRGYRIIYLSTLANGSTVPVSGMVIVPSQSPPENGRPVVAWAHPTTGVQPQCAPSLSPLRYQMIPGLREMLRRGYVVTATDYPGLGTGPVHPFLDGESEGHAVLDSIRAAASVPTAAASRRFALWGHSQGGQAVLFAGKLAARYAPELQLVGVAAAAPATDLAALLRDDLGTTGGNNLTALTLWSWARFYGADYSSIVQAAARPAIDAVANACIDALIERPSKKRADASLASTFLSVPDVAEVEPWRSLMARNSVKPLPSNIPVFLAQGGADVIVRPQITYGYGATLCADGTRLRLNVLPAIGHGWIAVKSALTAITWIGDRLDGVPPPSDCQVLTAIPKR